MVTNLTQFKCKNEPFIKYITEQLCIIVKENNLENKDDIIYISAPMTGIDNYSERFAQMYDWVKYIYHERDVFIINPSKYLDVIPEELNASYVDKMFYCFSLLSLCNILILDDSTDKWQESRGCLTELMYAQFNDIEIYGYDFVVNATRFRLFIDGHFNKQQDKELNNYFMEYETMWRAEE